jgi:predicted permease
MSRVKRLLFAARALWLRRNRERDLEEELRFHIEEEIEERASEGISSADATATAKRDFGNLALIQESTRESWGWSGLQIFFQDTRYGLRALRRNPGFALTAVLSLALGIGANTTIFSLLDAVLLRSLPVKNSEQLVVFAHRGEKEPSTGSNYPLFETLRQQSKSFTDMLAFWPIEFRLRSGTESEMTEGQYVTANYFSLLGVQPIAGRAFSESDFEEPVTVISHGLWQRKFAMSPDAIGKAIQVNGLPLTIIGVAPPEFFGLQLGWKLDLYIPFGVQKRLSPEFGDRLFGIRDGIWNLAIMGRLKEGTSVETARAEAEVLVTPWVNENILKDTGGKRGDWARIELLPGSRGLDGLRSRYSKPLLVLMTVAALVLLISCANVANLLLARAISRQRELAVRISIGASRMRLVRQLLSESLLLSFIGGIASIVLSVWCARLLVVYISDPAHPMLLPLSIDLRILLFTAAASLVTGLIFGVLPALRATRLDLTPALKDQRAAAQTSSSGRLKRLLVSMQVAVSLLLLVGAGLFVRSLANIRNLDPGFNPDRLLLVEFAPHGLGLSGERLLQRVHSYHEEVLKQFESIPGVRSAGFASLSPLTRSETTRWFTTAGFIPGQRGDSIVRVNVVSPRYFETMSIPVHAGRSFTVADRSGAPRVAILNEAAARFYFAGAGALGRTFRLGPEATSPPIEIVGIVRDIKQRDLREGVVRTVFVPFDQSPEAFGSIQVRSIGRASTLIPAIRATARSIDAEIPIATIRTVREQVDANLSQERLITMLSAAFGALALLLAAVGLYGVISYSVSARTGEIGIRMALGAGKRSVLTLVAKDIAWPFLLGVTGGLAAALVSARFLRTMLFGLEPTDAATFTIATLMLGAVACAAALLPTRRALSIEPVSALRNE